MLQGLSKFILKCAGWTSDVTVPLREKCIICVAPHTSNWDFILGELFFTSLGGKASFLMKEDWFFWPLGPIFRKMGGIPVSRRKNSSLTQQLTEVAQQSDRFTLAVTPEGTRKLTTKWRRGFYYIALGAQLPIQLYAIDGANKRIVCTREIMPTGDVEADIRTIMDYYRPYHGRELKKGKFSVEEV